MLGRFLELTVHCDAIMDSWSFYQRLGFGAALMSDNTPDAHSVVSDGRISIGLHNGAPQLPHLTFVHSDLVAHANALENLRLRLSRRDITDATFNQIETLTPDAISIRLLEARTFSPMDASRPSALGWFDEIVLSVTNVRASGDFWESLGCVLIDNGGDSWPPHTLTCDTINIGLCTRSRWKTPALLFSTTDLTSVRDAVERCGVVPEEILPRPLDPDTHLLVMAPEGTPLIVRKVSN